MNLLELSKSIEIAKKVTKEIYESTEILLTHSEIYELDRFKKNNNQNIRAYEKYNYRVSYQIDDTKIYILRIRHTSRKPLKY